jgi:hypothetical protein
MDNPENTEGAITNGQSREAGNIDDEKQSKNTTQYVLNTTVLSITSCALRYLQLFEGELMSNLRYLCLLVHSGVQHILCSVFALFFVVYVASFSGLSMKILQSKVNQFCYTMQCWPST